jgi:DNA-binding transcriptional ArsR family regulator
MPDLPARLSITTAEQFKAIADPTRSRILGIIQNQPATAKQIAKALDLAPGTVGHHLQVLESAGLAQIVARRLVRGIIAKYYTRTARIFNYEMPPEVMGEACSSLDIWDHARNELADAIAERGPNDPICMGFPHARLTPARVAYYERKLDELIEEMIQEPAHSNGEVYGFCGMLLHSPRYMQRVEPADLDDGASEGGDA